MAPACKLCNKAFKLPSCTPVALSCGHSFCRECLITAAENSKKLRCKTCMKPHNGLPLRDLPINGVFLNTDSTSPRALPITPSSTANIQEDFIFVIVQTASMMKIHIKIQRTKKIAELRLLLQIKYGIDENSGCLSTDTYQLDDDKCLMDYNISPETVIYTEGNEEKEEHIKSLGFGGFGKVYLIKKNEKDLVVKEVDLSRLHGKARALAIQEMKLLENLNHPNIVSYEGGYEKEDRLYTLMEYCSGGDLANQISIKIKEDGLFAERKILAWIQKISDALAYIHDRKIIHRDIKPANIFLNSSGTIKLGDFGISKVLGEATHASTMIGSSKYIATEVVNEIGFTTKADIFALGCCMYELAELKSNYPYIQVTLGESFSDSFKSLVVNLLDHNPDNRPDASEILRLPIFKRINEKGKATNHDTFLNKHEPHSSQEENDDEGEETDTNDDVGPDINNSIENLIIQTKPKPRKKSTVAVSSTPLKERSKEPSSESCILVLDSICGELKAGKELNQKALDDIIFSMKMFQQNVDVVHKGCSALNQVCKRNVNKVLTPAIKEEISSVLLSTLENQWDNDTVMMYCCLLLCDLRKRYALVMKVEQLMPRFLEIITPSTDEVYKDMSILTLSTIKEICQRVSEDIRKIIVQVGAIEVLLNIIRSTEVEEYDEDPLQVCWDIIVSLTDETPANCKVFVDLDGLPLILHCLSNNSTAHKWKMSVWITLSNISEVKELRSYLLQSDIVPVLLKHLDPSLNQTEVSWEAAQVLINILSDGAQAWTITSLERSLVMPKIAEAIEKWDVDSAPMCFFNTLRPIWLLLEADHTPVCQYWAIWTLAKLTRVRRDKYCPKVEEEGGQQRLQQLVKIPSKGFRRLRSPLKKEATNKLSAAILKLTMQVKNTCEDYKMYSGYGTKNRDQLTKLFKAAFNGELAAIEELIESELNLDSKSFLTGHIGRSAIQLATENGHIDVVCALIDAGASVNIKDSEGMIALHTAALRGHLELVKLLFVFGSDYDTEAKVKGWNVVHFAASGGHLPTLEFLKEKCDIKSLTRDKRSALHIAAEHGKEEAVSWAIKEDFNVLLKDSYSLTALDYAKQRYHKNVIQILSDFQN